LAVASVSIRTYLFYPDSIVFGQYALMTAYKNPA